MPCGPGENAHRLWLCTGHEGVLTTGTALTDPLVQHACVNDAHPSVLVRQRAAAQAPQGG